MYLHKIDPWINKTSFFLACLVFNCTLNAQIFKHGFPESYAFKNKETRIPVKMLDAIDTAAYRAEDVKKGIPNRYGVVQQVTIDIKAMGLKTEIPGKGTIWQYKIQSPQTYSLSIRFVDFFLPEGASVFIYNDTHTRKSGAFTSQNNKDNYELSIADFKGNHAIIEYFEPFEPEFEGELVIGSVAQSYKDISQGMLQPGLGEIGINCPQGANWQTVKHAVCRINFEDTHYIYTCTGFLVNNVRQDGTPYLQTANHCLTTNALAATLIAHFNFENSTCTSNDADSLYTLSVSGAKVVATNQYSDFTLLELNEIPPQSYLPYYAGWDATETNPTLGTCIHHPEGYPKCISLDTNPPTSYDASIQWYDDSNSYLNTSEPNSHWQVVFTTGSTQPGSSGSPLFDQNQRVIGQLHGGGTDSSYFGKFSLSWNYSSASTAQLKHWLDPDSTGTTVLNGFFNSKLPPIAGFTTSITNVCPGAPVMILNTSQFSVNYSWTISPSTFQFVNGTNNTSLNPEVTFNDTGKYTIQLNASNVNGTDSIVRSNYITSGSLKVSLAGVPADSIICGYNLINYVLTASGADTYSFNLERTDKIETVSSSDSITLSLISSQKKYGTFNSWVSVTGTQGKCTATDSALLIISMPPNDDLDNAIYLYPGRNIAYTNFCGSVQTNEPSPSFIGCTGQDSWCPTGGPLQHTIWFIVHGPSSGEITIDTHGFNDRIALYEADSSADIFINKYTLIAANDDRSTTDNTALLTNVMVIPGKSYWLQLDGYTGATGYCVIDLISNDLDVFPNPTSGLVNVYIGNTSNGTATVDIYSSLGAQVYSNSFYLTTLSNEITFNLSNLSAGLYVLKVTINGTTLNKKLLIIK